MQTWEISMNEKTLFSHPYPLQVAPIFKSGTHAL